MEAANSARPLPHFNYILGVSPPTSRSGYHLPVTQRVRSVSIRPKQSALYGVARPTCGNGTHRSPHMRATAKSTTAFTPYAIHSRRTTGFEEQKQTSKPQGEDPAQLQSWDKECRTELVATIAGGYAEGITWLAWKTQLKSAQQEVNSMGMICLPMHFGSKLKSKNLEVDFLVVMCPRPTIVQPQKKKSIQEKGGGLHIGLSTILMALFLRTLSYSIQGVGGLVPYLFTLPGRRDKLHLLRVTTVICGRLTLVHVVEVGLKIAVLLKLLGQLHQELA
ncbi:LOW QUALITY PROTEIN: hypothetical protein Cgig2_023436 [Carnegiea gigantea]|uniref:Uncharacterized protein n=1 Tax=Carnegiea gigantea TaxID=171969 RepID=A0A9Q1GN88_9CARY|nr:LOW QUALITY PROTEIN: hypothetical protein Cgig2_023436 [Carnegiea gigantea]